MSGRAALVVAPEVARYDHGPGHPLRPDRVRFTWDLIRAYGLDVLSDVEVLPGRVATDDEIMLVHRPDYVEATRAAGSGVEGRWAAYGFGPGDNPVFDGMHEAAAGVVGATLAAAEAVVSGRADHAFNAAGGLHHAMAARASGFCVYDDPAIAIAWMLGRGVGRIAYLDLDVHHGDGPQASFEREPRVLTVSIHESPATLFPGTGDLGERGSGPGVGTVANVPLPAGTGDGPWVRALAEVALPVIRAFGPDVLVTQLGCDTHRTDPLAHLRVTTAGYREAARLVHAFVHEVCGGRWIATGGGGYQRVTVVPRAWTIWFAEMAGTEVGGAIPEAWRDAVRAETGVEPPATLDDPEEPEEPEDDATRGGADEAVDRARRALVPTPATGD